MADADFGYAAGLGVQHSQHAWAPFPSLAGNTSRAVGGGHESPPKFRQGRQFKFIGWYAQEVVLKWVSTEVGSGIGKRRPQTSAGPSL